MTPRRWLAVMSAILLAACAATGAGAAGGDPHAQRAARSAAGAGPERLKVQVLETFPHDPGAFTQGLVLDGNVLYESTGQEGQSSLRRVDLTTGKVLQKVDQPAPIFSEGLAVVGPHLVQLTWKNGIVYQYDKKTFKRTREWGYSGEGWGICHDGKNLVTSDGSDRLTFRDTGNLGPRRVVHVTNQGQSVSQLNELECVGSSIYANVWNTDTIVRVDAATGRVSAVIDASGLLTPAERAQTDVFNGIAHDPASNTFLITGKYWPRMYRVKFVP